MGFYVPSSSNYSRFNMLPFANFFENIQTSTLLPYGDELLIFPANNGVDNFLALNRETKSARRIGKPVAGGVAYVFSIVEGANGRLICYCNGTGFFFSDDLGATWTASTASGNNYSLAANDDGSVIVGVTGSFITRSTDNGATFSSVTPAGFASGIPNSPSARFINGVFYALTQQSIWSSVDGSTWTKFDISTFYAGVPFGNISAIEYYDGNFYCGSSTSSIGVILKGATLQTMSAIDDYPVWAGFAGVSGGCTGIAIADNKLYIANATGTIVEINGANISGVVVTSPLVNANTTKFLLGVGDTLYYPVNNQIYTNIVVG